MLQPTTHCIIGLDLAGLSKNPSGIAYLKQRVVQTKLVYTDEQIREIIEDNKPNLIAIDAPLSIPKSGFSRTADRQMIKHGYRVLPPNFPHMQELTQRAVNLNKLLTEKTYRTIEVHPTSTRKALQILPSKDWRAIQESLKQIGLKGNLQTQTLSNHELDAITAALTAVLYLKKQTEQIGEKEEGYIIVPKKIDWRTLKL
jgi:predicted nuclease with RNAse H fold